MNRNNRNLFISYLVVVLVEKKLYVRDGSDNYECNSLNAECQ
jgi:hypothetical protein